ncbi:MAG: transcriptional regulator [Actinomycetota bacterium]
MAHPYCIDPPEAVNMRPLEHKKLLMVIAPSELQALVVKTARHRGVGGYTIVPATGAGESGLRSGMLNSDSNVVIYIIMSESRLLKVLEDLDALMSVGHRLKALVSDIAIMPRKPAVPG